MDLYDVNDVPIIDAQSYFESKRTRPIAAPAPQLQPRMSRETSLLDRDQTHQAPKLAKLKTDFGSDRATAIYASGTAATLPQSIPAIKSRPGCFSIHTHSATPVSTEERDPYISFRAGKSSVDAMSPSAPGRFTPSTSTHPASEQNVQQWSAREGKMAVPAPSAAQIVRAEDRARLFATTTAPPLAAEARPSETCAYLKIQHDYSKQIPANSGSGPVRESGLPSQPASHQGGSLENMLIAKGVITEEIPSMEEIIFRKDLPNKHLWQTPDFSANLNARVKIEPLPSYPMKKSARAKSPIDTSPLKPAKVSSFQDAPAPATVAYAKRPAVSSKRHGEQAMPGNTAVKTSSRATTSTIEQKSQKSTCSITGDNGLAANVHAVPKETQSLPGECHSKRLVASQSNTVVKTLGMPTEPTSERKAQKSTLSMAIVHGPPADVSEEQNSSHPGEADEAVDSMDEWTIVPSYTESRAITVKDQEIPAGDEDGFELV